MQLQFSRHKPGDRGQTEAAQQNANQTSGGVGGESKLLCLFTVFDIISFTSSSGPF